MRRRLLIACGILAALVLAAGVSAYFLYDRAGAWVIEEKVLPRIEQRLGRAVEIESVEVDRGTVTLRNLVVPGDPVAGKVSPLVSIESVTVSYDYAASWRGQVVVHEVSIAGLKAELLRAKDGSDNFSALLERLRPSTEAPHSQAGAGAGANGLMRYRPNSIRLVQGDVQLADQGRGSIAHLSQLSGIVDRSQEAMLTLGKVEFRSGQGPAAQLEKLIVKVDLSDPLGSTEVEIGNGQVTIYKGMSLTGISGVVKQGQHRKQLVIDLAGGYGGAPERLWEAQGWIEPLSRRGQLSIAAAHFTFDRIASVFQDSMVKDFDNTSVDAQLQIDVEEGVAQLAGKLKLSELNLQHEMLAEETMRDINVETQVQATIDSHARTVILSALDLKLRGVDYQLSGQMALPGGVLSDGTRRTEPSLRAHVVVPKAPCQAVLESIPAEFVPKLQGFELGGNFQADVLLEVDWSDIENSTVLDGFVDLPKCKVIHANEEFDTRRLAGTFEHQTLVGPDEYESVEIGMESDDYVQIFDIASPFLNAVLTQEDSRFYDHKGFIPREFRSALVRNLLAGRFKFGASSITMQMVKNVFLYRDKTISRKLQELFLTWYVEKTLDKNRILEIYVNAIEYGPGVYGIVQASQIYFDKHPRELEPVEAAFLAHLLPAPRVRYFQYCKGKMSRRWQNKLERILKNMHKRKRLTDEEFAEASETTIEFNPDKVRTLCKKPPDW